MYIVCSDDVNPFSTAVPIWGQTKEIPSFFSPKRGRGTKRPYIFRLLSPCCNFHFSLILSLIFMLLTTYLPFFFLVRSRDVAFVGGQTSFTCVALSNTGGAGIVDECRRTGTAVRVIRYKAAMLLVGQIVAATWRMLCAFLVHLFIVLSIPINSLALFYR